MEKLDNQAPSPDQVAQLESCQRRLQEKEIMLKKTQKIFQAKIRELKENVEYMFGYTLSCPEESQFSLVSLYAESPTHNLLFKKGDVHAARIPTCRDKVHKLHRHAGTPLKVYSTQIVASLPVRCYLRPIPSQDHHGLIRRNDSGIKMLYQMTETIDY
eukprot:sb/3473010/